jgi:hypothetical protein
MILMGIPLKDQAYNAAVRSPLLYNAYYGLNEYYLWFRLNRRVTDLLGTLYRPNTRLVQIDLTYECNLTCPNCSRSCTQAPTNEHMTVGQVKKFLDESVSKGWRWRRIDLMGGEPTLHPDFSEIVNLVKTYRDDYSPATVIGLLTNATIPQVAKVLGKTWQALAVASKPLSLRHFESKDWYSFNTAPQDLPRLSRMDFTNGCWVTKMCGLGLNRYGYYLCGDGAGIDRIFGFDIGRKHVPDPDDDFMDQKRILCRYCGSFHRNFKRIDIGITQKFANSPTWAAAYKKYKHQKPAMTLY